MSHSVGFYLMNGTAQTESRLVVAGSEKGEMETDF
jgi:hypothetical protein